MARTRRIDVLAKAPDHTWNRFFEIPVVCRLLLVAVLLQIVILFSLRMLQYFDNIAPQALATTNVEASQKEQLWILLFFIINAIFQLYFAVNSILQENVVELWCVFGASLLMTARAIYEESKFSRYCQSGTGGALCSAVLAVTMMFQIGYIVLFFFVYRSFGWRFYRLAGGDLQLRALYTVYEIFCSWLKFDVLFHLLFGYTVWMFSLADAGYNLRWLFIMLFLIASVGFSLLGWQAMKRESPLLSWIWAVFSVGTPVVTIVMMVMFNADKLADGADMSGVGCFGNNSECAVSTAIFLLLGGVLILCRALQYVFGLQCYLNFGSGLKEKVHYVKSMRSHVGPCGEANAASKDHHLCCTSTQRNGMALSFQTPGQPPMAIEASKELGFL